LASLIAISSSGVNLLEFSDADVAQIADTYHCWREGSGYEDVPFAERMAGLTALLEVAIRENLRGLGYEL
jgi:hypothetical protein